MSLYCIVSDMVNLIIGDLVNSEVGVPFISQPMREFGKGGHDFVWSAL